MAKNYNIEINKNIKIGFFYEAMTHKSYVAKKQLRAEDYEVSKNSVKLQKKCNNRLKILGVSVIHFILAEFLFKNYGNNNDEGFLTRLRSKLENKHIFFDICHKIGLAEYVLFNQTTEILYGRNNVNIISHAFEAFIGAVYKECGINITRNLFLNIISREINIDEISTTENNYKDLVLQIYSAHKWGTPEYRVLREYGLDHKKEFKVGIYLKNRLVGKGKASSKKKAEQLASKQMYEKYQKKIQEKKLKF